MTTPEDEDREDAPAMPGRELLDAWTVPEPGADLTDRVLQHMEASLASETVVSMQERRRGGVGLALVGIAMVAAAALVLSLVQLWSAGPGQREAPAVAAPIVVRIPYPVAVPTPVEAVPVAVEPPTVEAPPTVEEPPVEAPPTVERPRKVEATSERPQRSRDLKNPFAFFGSDKHRDPAKSKPREPAGTATLRIRTGASYSPATVYLDGKAIGTTPIVKTKVPAGLHTVEWAWPDGEWAKSTVTLEAGETQVLEGLPSDLKNPYR